MPVRNWRKNCLRCNKSFLTYLEDMVYCNSDCEGKHKYEKHFNKEKDFGVRKCLSCGLKISGRSNYCGEGCQKMFLASERRAESILKSKEDRPVKELPKRRVSYDELNRRSEYKRLYDDFHIDRQINGRARDLI